MAELAVPMSRAAKPGHEATRRYELRSIWPQTGLDREVTTKSLSFASSKESGIPPTRRTTGPVGAMSAQRRALSVAVSTLTRGFEAPECAVNDHVLIRVETRVLSRQVFWHDAGK